MLAGLAPLMLCSLVAPMELLGHDTGSSFLQLEVEGSRITGRWEIALADLQDVAITNMGGVHPVSPEEAAASFSAVRNYSLDRLKMRADGMPVTIRVDDSGVVMESTDRGTNFTLALEALCPQKPDELEVEYRLLFETLPNHRGLLLLSCDGRTQTAMFTPARTVQRFKLATPDRPREFTTFVREGAWHIWIGYDHILFLVALLLPSVLRWEEQGWRPVSRISQAFWNVFKIVTAFTIAHSITLGLAGLEIISLPGRWVESIIAASVLLAALNNVRPIIHSHAWIVAFVFGLIHGFGFASVLAEVGLPRENLVTALVGFNVGVELGQLALVGVVLPAAYAFRRRRMYPRVWMPGLSCVIALLAAIWMAERVLGLESGMF